MLSKLYQIVTAGFGTRIVATFLSMVAIPLVVSAHEGAMSGMHHMWDGEGHGWIFGPFMMVVFIVLAVVLIVVLVRWLGSAGRDSAPSSTPTRTPLDILKERFARGEIDKAEFEESRRILGE